MQATPHTSRSPTFIAVLNIRKKKHPSRATPHFLPRKQTKTPDITNCVLVRFAGASKSSRFVAATDHLLLALPAYSPAHYPSIALPLCLYSYDVGQIPALFYAVPPIEPLAQLALAPKNLVGKRRPSPASITPGEPVERPPFLALAHAPTARLPPLSSPRRCRLIRFEVSRVFSVPPPARCIMHGGHTALVPKASRHQRRLLLQQPVPAHTRKEGVRLHRKRTAAADPPPRVFSEQRTDEALAGRAHVSLRALPRPREACVLVHDVEKSEARLSVLAGERGLPEKQLVGEDAQPPPVDGASLRVVQ